MTARRWGRLRVVELLSMLVAVVVVLLVTAPSAWAEPFSPCKTPPEPVMPRTGAAGLVSDEPASIPQVAPDPFTDPSVAISDVYGWSWQYTTYDLGCGLDVLNDASWTAGLQEAVAGFLTAWSTVDAEQRAIGLSATATASLAEQLLVTDPDEVPPACVFAGALEVADLTPTSVLVTVPTTCEGVLWLGLDRDPTAPHGWRVTAIGKERSWIQ